MEAQTNYRWMFEVEYVANRGMECRGFHDVLYNTLAEARQAILATRSQYAQLVRMVRLTDAQAVMHAADGVKI